mgnify:CR=1 FL=1
MIHDNTTMQQHLKILVTAFADVRMSHPYLAYLLAFAFIVGCLKVFSWLKKLLSFLIIHRFFSPSNVSKFIKKGESWAGMLQYPQSDQLSIIFLTLIKRSFDS